jgi:hypothetical protein
MIPWFTVPNLPLPPILATKLADEGVRIVGLLQSIMTGWHPIKVYKMFIEHD